MGVVISRTNGLAHLPQVMARQYCYTTTSRLKIALRTIRQRRSGGAAVGQPNSQEFMKVLRLVLSFLGQHVMVITF